MQMPWQNLRYAIRGLRKNPGFTIVAVLSLALGIGANTAIFTLINALLLRDLPVRQPERLVKLSAIRPDGKVPFSYPMFREVERGQRVFTGLIGWGTGGMFNVEVNGILSHNHVLTVTGNCHSELGVAPLLGRLLVPEDANPGSGATSQVAVIGYEFWQHRFGGSPDVVGKQIRVEGQPFTIIGVTRKWFTGLNTGEPPEVTIPITAAPLIQGGTFNLGSRSVLWVTVTGRLKDGVSIEQARAQLQSFWPAVLLATASTETPGLRRQTFLSMGLEVSSAAKGIAADLRSQFTRPLYVLAGIVGLILLVACVNLANLMLARAAARSHEMSVRVAIGASRWALARQVLTESLALSLAGALLGLAFAFWGSRLLVLLMTQGNLFLVSLDLSPDLRVLSLTVSVAILTGILFGLAPAWRCSREDPASVLQQNARSMSGGTGKLSKALIITQVALSLVLLLGAGLLVRSFERLRSVDLGFQKESVLEVRLNPKPGGYQNLDLNSYHKQLLERVSSVPGVRSVGYSDNSLSSGAEAGWRDLASPMSADPAAGVNVKANGMMVSPGFFRTLGIRLLRGRDFDETDDERHPRLAVVNSGLAERLFPNGDAIGKTVRFGFMPDYQNIQIVGIASNARIVDLRDSNAPAIFLSYLQYPPQWGNLIVRTKEAPEALAKTVGQEIEALGHEYPLHTKTVAQVISQELVEERVTAMLSGFFAVLALLLASIGLYGLMSYAVTRRTREIGIRVALGAQRENVLWIVLRETLVLALFGIAIGIPSALAATRFIASMLFGLSPRDLPTIAGVSLLLLLVALLAGYLPARRASGIDPMVALRAE
ncbi:MAG TPA: ABC transporter permease [Candidatus Acidoferrum sp.]